MSHTRHPITAINRPGTNKFCESKTVYIAMLIEASRCMSKSTSSGTKILQVLQLLSKWTELHYSRVLLPNYQTRELEVGYYYGLPHEKVTAGAYTVPFDQGLTGYVWRSGQVALVTDLLSESVFLTRIAEPINGSLHHVGFISVPIIVDGRTVGVISAQRRANPRRRYADDVDLLRVIATMIGPVLQQVRHRAKNISIVPGQLDKDSGHFVQLCESHGIIGSSKVLLSAVKEIIQVKDSDAPIMLLGESGTGKEMFAGMLHRESPRKSKPFICINCASIPAALLESELFGHEKGSFTGAHRRQVGKIEQAHEGTLFLDEIGDMPLDLQAKLLRVLQDKHIQPIGSDKPRRVDFRLITATHVNLADAMRDGRFRLDLYYRLNVIPISLPPLRSRLEDIPRLAEHFLSHYGQVYDRSIQFTQGVHDCLQAFPWRGNIRQLQNVIERAVLKADGQWINVTQIREVLAAETMPKHDTWHTGADATVRSRPDIGSDSTAVKSRQYCRVREADAESIRDALRQTDGNQARAARLLGFTARQLRYRLKKLDFEEA
jgi:Nif-specific regulatory protein